MTCVYFPVLTKIIILGWMGNNTLLKFFPERDITLGCKGNNSGWMGHTTLVGWVCFWKGTYLGWKVNYSMGGSNRTLCERGITFG